MSTPLQRCRSSIAAEGARQRPRDLRPLRFNGAAALLLRKGGRAARPAVRFLAASTVPQLYCCGRPPRGASRDRFLPGFNGAAALLLRKERRRPGSDGADSASTVPQLYCCGRVDENQGGAFAVSASTVPQLYCCGRSERDGPERDGHAASTVPQLYCCGRRPRPLGRVEAAPCFNGAAALLLRKDPHVRRPLRRRRASTVPQLYCCGRPRIEAIGRELDGFNGAAALLLRKGRRRGRRPRR